MEDRARIEEYLAVLSDYKGVLCRVGDYSGLYMPVETDIDTILRHEKKLRENLKKSGKPEEWGKIGIVARDQWVIWLRDLIWIPGKEEPITYIRTMYACDSNKKSGLLLLPVTKDKKIVFSKAWRHSIGCYTIELPGTFVQVKEGSSIEEHVKDCYLRETGISVSKIEFLGQIMAERGLISSPILQFLLEIDSGDMKEKKGSDPFTLGTCLLSSEEFKHVVTSGYYEDAGIRYVCEDNLTFGLLYKAQLKGLI